MLPLYLLTSAKGQPILVELKSGETVNGNLVNCDSWMNLTLDNCIKVDPSGEVFLKLKEIYIRGNQIKYLRMSNAVIDQLKEQQMSNNNAGYNNSYDHRNRRGNSRGQGRRYNSGGRGGYRGGRTQQQPVSSHQQHQQQQQPPQQQQQQHNSVAY
ncbi:hypothetical protein PACTADRAFT_35822 [Pachysolen tannophilus NRRL Y-2460]|uniref:LSM complex subunit LSM4 n=1 Tax=Pachysolen tannophilus NRRL Y-2460 TaxID=669874 RepID=A0A1E4TN83_PACTA|nr:hypothetical protein PACTADRAFT_35822 [Pachysolen tannophilus NRRL Y-2460]